MIKINKPSQNEVEKTLIEVKEIPYFYFHNEVLEKVFKEYKNNNDVLEISIKAGLLNNFYSTNIRQTNMVLLVNHIKDLNIDKRLKEKDLSLVDDLKKVKIDNKSGFINYYSFASKYCFFSDPNVYSIYDSFVDKMLVHFNEEYNFTKINIRDEIKNYLEFKKIMNDFISFFELEKFSLREIDIYLWVLGKKINKISK